MTFTKIDRNAWPREEYFNHYFSQLPCTYSGVFKLDITRLRQSGQKLYPAMLYCLSTVVNRHQEFRMALDEAGEPGYYDVVHPPPLHHFPEGYRDIFQFVAIPRLLMPSAPRTSGIWRRMETTRA